MDSPLLEDEKFDFDLPLSPDEERDQDEEDDEIFFGPIGHNERCVAAKTETKVSKYIDEVESFKPLSPLNPEQVVEIFKEATSMALMFRTSSSEAVVEDQDKKSSSDFPELISDEAESRRRALKCENTIKNEDGTAKTLENSTKLTEKMSENEGDKFVVRKRVLKERNIKSSINKESPKNTIIKPQLVKKGQIASAQNRGSNSVSKLQKFKTNSKSTYQNSPLKVNKMLIYGVVEDNSQSPANKKSDIKKSSVGTPRKFSSSSSKADRSFSSTKSSSTSDTSFTEETTKQSKLPMPSQSGLKAPGFSSGRRKRTSSNSSNSSTSSTSALNETFTLTRSSGSPNSTKQSRNNKPQPNSKPLLTKIGLSKPTFAKPNEVPKTSKLQPLKALQRAPAGSARSMSATGLKSPAQTKSIPRAASAGSTPLRAQTPIADRTPSKGTTPIRRRSSINTSASMAAKKRQSSGLVPPSDTVKRSTTPVRKLTSEAASNGLAVQRKANRGMKGERINEKPGKDKKPTTPESKLNDEEKFITTPKNTGEKQTNGQMSRSVNCKKRRSFIPTPNLNRTMEPQKNVDSGSPQAPSHVPFNLSPTISKQCEKTESNKENDEPIVVLNFNTSDEEKDLKFIDPQSPESPNEDTISDATLSELSDKQSSGVCKTNSPDAMQTKELDLMIQESPLPIKKVSLDDFVDPFSPGIPTPDLPSDDCLNPVVLQIDTKDLIDLSHMSPKPEPDLIDLAAESPVHLVEAKLVDI
ncbi:mucin-5AC-like [Actinia tenebrosa]|uniref:Mucin-5AC-like n=1 Tax=Actinia tenebrosa TaxID=6105 RepID=A0A6P8IUE3_ACTTE|nr:mucin-5AC-like [Actinia tenebrosa]